MTKKQFIKSIIKEVIKESLTEVGSGDNRTHTDYSSEENLRSLILNFCKNEKPFSTIDYTCWEHMNQETGDHSVIIKHLNDLVKSGEISIVPNPHEEREIAFIQTARIRKQAPEAPQTAPEQNSAV